jgi:4-amino-4-deoxy-L-arabinose transferase-like glycosyltransferase
LPFAVGVCVIKGVFKRFKADLLMLVWMLTVLLVFSLAQTKIYFYLLPAFPAFAIAIGSLLYQLLNKIYTFFHLMMLENLGSDPFLGVPRF